MPRKKPSAYSATIDGFRAECRATRTEIEVDVYDAAGTLIGEWAFPKLGRTRTVAEYADYARIAVRQSQRAE